MSSHPFAFKVGSRSSSVCWPNGLPATGDMNRSRMGAPGGTTGTTGVGTTGVGTTGVGTTAGAEPGSTGKPPSSSRTSMVSKAPGCPGEFGLSRTAIEPSG